jgi:hypothetical protein
MDSAATAAGPSAAPEPFSLVQRRQAEHTAVVAAFIGRVHNLVVDDHENRLP